MPDGKSPRTFASLPILDRLSRDPEAIALAEVITSRSALPPLAIGLFGDWGEGKSHFLGRVETHARVIVVKYERARVLGVALAADARVSGAEVTVGKVHRQHRFFMLDPLAAPRAILTVRGHDNPFFTQRVPSFFPDHSLQSKEQTANDKATTCLAQISLIQAYCVRVYYRTTSQVFSRRLPAFRHV